MPAQPANVLNDSRTRAATHRSPFPIGLPAALVTLLLLTAAWRALLSLQIALHLGNASALAAGQGAIVVHWRQLDSLLGWIALLILILSAPGALRPTSLGQARANRAVTRFVSLAIFLALLSIAADQWGLGGAASRSFADILSYAADLSLALVGSITVFRELRSFSRDIPTGLTLLHLWRLIILQWLLAWIGAVVFLRFSMKKDDLASNEAARQLLFALPCIGLLPNVLMSVGIRWWNVLAPLPHAIQPRVRAWILSLFTLNAGALFMVLRSTDATWLGIPGAALLLFSFTMYVAGFPAGAWKTVSLGKPMLLAWATLLSAILLALAERFLMLGEHAISMAFLGSAWRHLLVAGTLLWLIAIAAAAQEHHLPKNHRRAARRASLLAVACVVLGVVLITLLLLAAALARGDAQTKPLRFLFLGTLLELLAILIAAAMFFRTTRLLPRQEAS